MCLKRELDTPEHVISGGFGFELCRLKWINVAKLRLGPSSELNGSFCFIFHMKERQRRCMKRLYMTLCTLQELWLLYPCYPIVSMRGPVVRDRDFPDNTNLQAMSLIDICGMV